MIVAGITTQREPRTSVARRLMDPDWIDRNDPASGRDAGSAATTPSRASTPGAGCSRRSPPTSPSQPLLTPRDLRRIELPAMVCVGDRDVFVPVDHAWGLARQLPDARLLVAPDCPHEIVSRRPALFNEACAEFFRSTETIARGRSGGAREPLTRPADPTDDPIDGTEGGSM